MRRLTRFFAFALLALLLAVPAFAGATRFDIQASGAQTAAGNGGGISVAGIKELIVFMTCTASSTPTQLDVYLQSSSDGGTTWYDLPYEVAMVLDGDATETAGTTNGRDVLNTVTSCASAVSAVARYTNFGDYVRAKWFLTGTSFTFSVKAIGKN